MYAHLVFSGGSTKIPLHVGFAQALEYYHIKPVGFLGTSAGAIIAGCMAIGYDFNKLYKLVIGLDFANFVNDSNFFSFFSNKYLSSGKNLELQLQDIFGKIKFEDLNKTLRVFAHDPKKHTYFEFSNNLTPTSYVWEAIRASISVPFLFKPFQGFIDGGISKNFPIDLVDGPFIGHLIGSKQTQIDDSSILSYGLSLIDEILYTNVEDSIKEASNKGIVIQSFYNLPLTEFSVRLDQKVEMIDLGFENTKEILQDCLRG